MRTVGADQDFPVGRPDRQRNRFTDRKTVNPRTTQSTGNRVAAEGYDGELKYARRTPPPATGPHPSPPHNVAG